MKGTQWKKSLCLTALTVFMAVGLSACGQSQKNATDEEILASMKEYTSESESVSIYLDSDMTTEDLGVDTWIGVKSQSNNDEIVIAQLPKALYSGTVNTLEDLQDMMEKSFQITNAEAANAPEISILSNLSAINCTLNSGTTSGDGYIIYGESDYAFYMLAYSSRSITNEKIRRFNISSSTLNETATEEENNFSTEMTDTIRWFDASYAILTRLNNYNVQYFGGLAANDTSASITQASLEASWSVTDRASADETMEWILSEGHRADFKDAMQNFVDAGIQNVAADARKDFILENYDMTEEEAQYYVNLYANYEQYGENVIDAWDYCRALSLAAFYYHAGYYTEQEALDKSLEIAQILQSLYTSWDEAMNSYLLGYEYWSEESSDERRAIYEELKAENDSLYNIDWNLSFEKTW